MSQICVISGSGARSADRDRPRGRSYRGTGVASSRPTTPPRRGPRRDSAISGPSGQPAARLSQWLIGTNRRSPSSGSVVVCSASRQPPASRPTDCSYRHDSPTAVGDRPGCVSNGRRTCRSLPPADQRRTATASATLRKPEPPSASQELSSCSRSRRRLRIPTAIGALKLLPDAASDAQSLQLLHRFGWSIRNHVKGVCSKAKLGDRNLTALERQPSELSPAHPLCGVGRRPYRLYEGRPLVKPGVRSLTPQPDKSPGERCRVKRLSKVTGSEQLGLRALDTTA